MAEITAALIKELRATTGAGMMDCKKALTETDGDVESAVDWLRKKGLAAAAKKAGRVAAEGLIGVTTDATRGAMVEVNSETDFVARNAAFQDFVRQAATLAMDAGGDLGALKAMAYPGTGRSVEAELTQLIAVIGENLSLRRTITISVTKGVMGSYVHNQTAPGLGKIGVLVALESGADTAKLSGLGKQLAMHIAATSPQAVDTADLDPAAVERERKILAEQARASGKPEEIIEKMVEGRLRKFYEEVCLLEQTYVIDGESKVRKALDAASSELGGAIKVSAFVRYQVGEGIDRGPDDFAAEVAAQLR